MARPTPVLPLVGSMMVPPGRSWPPASARSTIARPIRSFTDPPGFRYSTLARIVGSRPRPSRDNRTIGVRSEEHTSELQSPYDIVCSLLLEKKNNTSSSYFKFKKKKKYLLKNNIFNF